jgi:hypothetical protein
MAAMAKNKATQQTLLTQQRHPPLLLGYEDETSMWSSKRQEPSKKPLFFLAVPNIPTSAGHTHHVRDGTLGPLWVKHGVRFFFVKRFSQTASHPAIPSHWYSASSHFTVPHQLGHTLSVHWFGLFFFCADPALAHGMHSGRSQWSALVVDPPAGVIHALRLSPHCKTQHDLRWKKMKKRLTFYGLYKKTRAKMKYWGSFGVYQPSCLGKVDALRWYYVVALMGSRFKLRSGIFPFWLNLFSWTLHKGMVDKQQWSWLQASTEVAGSHRTGQSMTCGNRRHGFCEKFMLSV